MSIEIGDGGLGYIYLGDILIAGGGGESGWKPGVNTIAYYPLTSSTTVNDMSGNNKNLTNNSISFGEFNGVNCAYNSTNLRYLTTDLGLKISNTNFTINMYAYKTGGNIEIYMFCGGTRSNNKTVLLQRKTNNLNFAFWYDDVSSTQTLSNNTRYNICATYNTNTKSQKIYINGALDNSRTATNGIDVGDTSITLFNDNWGSRDNTFYGGISNVILESKEWSATEVSDYYNQTKSNYGL